MYYLKCNHCGGYNEIKTEFQIFCSICGKKLENNFKEWEKRNPGKNFEDFVKIECTTEKEEVIVKKQSSKGWKFWAVFTTAAIISAVIVSFAIKGIDYLTSNSKIDPVLVEVANSLNKTAPMMVDQYTRLDNTIVLPKRSLQYNYSIMVKKQEVNIEEVRKTLTPNILNNIKTNPQMQELRDYDVTFNYNYKDINGKFLLLISITPEMYK